MTENNYNNTNFHHSILLKISIKEAYWYAASAIGLEKWFIGKAVYYDTYSVERPRGGTAKKNDTFSWYWLEKDLNIKGKVIDSVLNKKFSFTFGNSFEVTITLKESNGRTLFTLSQNYAPGAEQNDFAHINCCVCWGFFMVNLKSVAEFGNDLREINADDESLINR